MEVMVNQFKTKLMIDEMEDMDTDDDDSVVEGSPYP
jgi:hypothetical protein